jgi:hypothetical protein
MGVNVDGLLLNGWTLERPQWESSYYSLCRFGMTAQILNSCLSTAGRVRQQNSVQLTIIKGSAFFMEKTRRG